MADGWDDVARNFALGFSLTSNLEDQRKRQALAEKADTRAQETHNSQQWREQQAQSFMNSHDQYNLTGDPNAYLDYAKTYHPQIFPDANAQYSIAKDQNTGVSTLFMAGQDGAQQPVSTPQGQPLQFDDTTMQKFMLGHIDPKALSKVTTAKIQAQAEVDAAGVKARGAAQDQGTASALNMGGIQGVNTGNAIQFVGINQGAGTATPTGQALDMGVAPHDAMVDQGNQKTAIRIGSDGNYTTVGTFKEGVSPNTQYTSDAQRGVHALTGLKTQQELVKNQIGAVTSTLGWLNTKYGGNPMQIDPADPSAGLLAALSLGKSKAYDNLAAKAKTDPEAQQDLKLYNEYMTFGFGLTKALSGMGDQSVGGQSQQTALGAMSPNITTPSAAQTSGQQEETPPAAGAKKAPDGNWYVPDPSRPGKYLRVK